MQEYKGSYLILWKGITTALEALEEHNLGIARDVLIEAQKNAEEEFISWEEAKNQT